MNAIQEDKFVGKYTKDGNDVEVYQNKDTITTIVDPHIFIDIDINELSIVTTYVD